MVGMPVTLEELLKAREERAMRQNELLSAYECDAIVSFTVNYPGPIKLNDDTRRLHSIGVKAISLLLLNLHVSCSELEEKNTGPEAFWVVRTCPLELKRLTCELEESHSLGRLFDIDVIGKDGKPIGRTQLGLSERKCLLCDGNTTVCRREGRHLLNEFTTRVSEMLKEYMNCGVMKERDGTKP